jgi:hypothetical protein
MALRTGSPQTAPSASRHLCVHRPSNASRANARVHACVGVEKALAKGDKWGRRGARKARRPCRIANEGRTLRLVGELANLLCLANDQSHDLSASNAAIPSAPTDQSLESDRVWAPCQKKMKLASEVHAGLESASREVRAKTPGRMKQSHYAWGSFLR